VDKLLCPHCGEELLESFVAPEFDRSSFGDYFCTECPPNREGGLYHYFWANELNHPDLEGDEPPG